ncbi:MAG: adenylate/guanylate cyclase domain-containing protein [Verrucomicrobiota bacterium]
METDDHKQFKTWLLTEIVDYRRRSQLEPKLTLQLARRDGMWMRELIAYHNGEVTGPSGDCNSGLMACFEENHDAFACAISLQEGFMEAAASASHPGQVLSHRIGLHFGEVFQVGGVTVGDCLTTAKKLRDRAEANEIILSHPTVVMLGGLQDRQPIYEGEKELPGLAEAVRVYRLPPPVMAPQPELVAEMAPESGAEPADEAAALGVTSTAAAAGITADPNSETAARRVAAMRRAMIAEKTDPGDFIMPPEAAALEPQPKTGSPAASSGPTLVGTARYQHLAEGRLSGSGGYAAVYTAVILAAEQLKAKAVRTEMAKGILSLELSGWLRRARIEVLFYQGGEGHVILDTTGDRENKQQAANIQKLFDLLCEEPIPVSYTALRERSLDPRTEAPEHRPSARPSPFGRR